MFESRYTGAGERNMEEEGKSLKKQFQQIGLFVGNEVQNLLPRKRPQFTGFANLPSLHPNLGNSDTSREIENEFSLLRPSAAWLPEQIGLGCRDAQVKLSVPL